MRKRTTAEQDLHAESHSPPTADVRPKRLESHGQLRIDPYYWLRDRKDPEVIAYLEAENGYAENVLAHLKGLRKTLREEIISRIPQKDESVPYFDRGYYYFSRYGEGLEYAIFLRRKGSPDCDDEIMLDGNVLAEGNDFFSIGSVDVSGGNDLIAFTTDTSGNRIYTLRFKDLSTGRRLPDEIAGVSPSHAWAADNRTIFYTKMHPETLRWYQIFRHELGTDPSEDVLVYEEEDESFSAYVYLTSSRRYLVIGSSQTVTDECWILDAGKPNEEFVPFEARQRGHEYSIDHVGDRFFIRTNLEARNFRLMEAQDGATSSEHWKEIVPHREEVMIGAFEVFRRFLVLSERKGGLVRLRVISRDTDEDHEIAFGEPAYRAALGDNFEFDTDVLRFHYESMTTPNSVFDYDMRTRETTLKKRDRVGGGFDSEDYVTERELVPARDGTLVPVSIVRRADLDMDRSHPLLLYGYGSYGASQDATFGYARLSLLDRGFMFAIAHVRGGEELGRQWYDDGRLLNKKNTFTDFIDVTEFMVAVKGADPDRLFAYGGSAGGLLMGAVMNMRPDLWTGIIASVPFVDVVTTMLDSDIPLTAGEYDEWGDPNQKDHFEYILSYSPYDQVEPKDYPHLLVTTGIHDSQVQYWEPAKWVAKLRAKKTGDNLVILITKMDAGHVGASGRFRQHEETALKWAFLLDLAGWGR